MAESYFRKNERYAAVTIVTRSYLAMAVTSAKSFLRLNPELTYYVYVLDDVEEEDRDLLQKCGLNYIGPADVDIEDLNYLLFRYDVTEACTAVKPAVMMNVFSRGFDGVVYLDPDLFCKGRLTLLFDALQEHQIILTPHVVTPIPHGYALDESLLLVVGAFNLGFLALRRDIAADFCNWWSARLRTQCHYDPAAGMFYDQKWIDLASSLFDRVFVLKDRGYNVAWWNLHERTMAVLGQQWILKETQAPLVFFHFSALPEPDDPRISRNVPLARMSELYHVDSNPALRLLFKEYREQLAANGHLERKSIPYRYNFFQSGEPILQNDRKNFSSRPDDLRPLNPFEKKSERIGGSDVGGRSSWSNSGAKFLLKRIRGALPVKLTDKGPAGV